MLRINLGCGRDLKPGWINVDRVGRPGLDVIADLNGPEPLPFEGGCADEMLLSHVLEHVPNSLWLMEELYRIAKPGAQLKIHVPYGSSDDAWEDPTHVRPYFINSFGYFSQPWYWRADYGYRGDWEATEIALLLHDRLRGRAPDDIMQALRIQRNVVIEMIATLTAIKPYRPADAALQSVPKITFAFGKKAA